VSAEARAPLRILHVVEVFGSGVGIVAKTLAERQAEAGEEVLIAHGRCPETPAEVRGFVAPAVGLRELPWRTRSLAEQLRAGRALRRLVGEWRPDVVHLHSSFAGVVGAIALPRRVPSVYTPHGYSFTMRDRSAAKRLAFRAAERFTAARADLVGAVSAAEAADARLVAPARKVTVVPNGIPELDRPPPPRPPAAAGARPLVVTVGRVAEQHMPAETATILAAVADLADVLWVGGEGRSPELDQMVRERGVRVSGWLEREEVQTILASATACLHWTAWDGQPLSVLEAMAADVVVIAREIAATREILGSDQVCATPEEATATLRLLLSEAAARERLLAAQRERRPRYGSRRMAAEWRAVYARLAEPAAVRPSPDGALPAARGSRWGRRARRYESAPEVAP
jgi:glycosyltransferase involved in cell wall biosynthesis